MRGDRHDDGVAHVVALIDLAGVFQVRVALHQQRIGRDIEAEVLGKPAKGQRYQQHQADGQPGPVEYQSNVEARQR